ncbi:lysylphosphatidylglycerol synthase domain-containing protein [Qipengyuania seohaensis]|uniref:lysylphosphatidylglycerol synthase domain-containing protein n=1 Tax=Qipengyuania seohaensis TaxID=266951 RepID=UPI0018E27482|nr:lysylphosphatidylglycerol synthase domain-containing protein [Qipengyuania seohaensis]
MKRLAHIAGTAIFLACLGLIGYFVFTNWPSRIDIGISVVLAAALVYFTAHLTNVLSWLAIVRALGSQLSLKDGGRIVLISQVGKYLPGNVAHHVGRAALAKRMNVPLKVSAISTGIEMASAILASAFVGAAALVILPEIPTSAMIAFVLVLLAAIAIYFSPWKPALWSLPYLTVSTALNCLSFQLVEGSTWALPAFALAWLLGFLVPGAPGGLGVREAALVAMLGPNMAPIIIHRLMTVVVDALVATVASLTLKTKKSAGEVSSGSDTLNG